MLSLTRTAALLTLSAGAALVPVRMDVHQALSNPAELFQVSRACAAEAAPGQEVAGCKPNPGYICVIDHVQWVDKEPIIINTASAQAVSAD
jgi:hypothetical protein